MPQQCQLAAEVDLESFMLKAEKRLNFKIKNFVKAGRLSGDDKIKRDLLLYFIWQAGYWSNEQIGNRFGVSYSAVSHIVRSFKTRLNTDQKLQAKLIDYNSLFKL